MRTISGGDGADRPVEPERAEPVDEVADQAQRDVGDDHRQVDRAVAERRGRPGPRVRPAGAGWGAARRPGRGSGRRPVPAPRAASRSCRSWGSRAERAAAGAPPRRRPRRPASASYGPRMAPGQGIGAEYTGRSAVPQRLDLPLPPPPARLLRRGGRPAARRPHPAQRGRAGQGPPRLPLRRLARDRQDLDGEDPRPLAQLRARRADDHPLRRVRVLPDDRRRHLDRRDRDGRRLQPLGRRRPRPARAGRLRPGRRPLEGLHPRRGAHAHQGGLERLPEDARGAAAEHRLRARDHRVAQGDGDDRRPLPALRLPAALAGADLRGARTGRRGRGDRGRGGGDGDDRPLRLRAASATRSARSTSSSPSAARRSPSTTCWSCSAPPTPSCSSAPSTR